MTYFYKYHAPSAERLKKVLGLYLEKESSELAGLINLVLVTKVTVETKMWSVG